jgi:hypothetical protein
LANGELAGARKTRSQPKPRCPALNNSKKSPAALRTRIRANEEYSPMDICSAAPRMAQSFEEDIIEARGGWLYRRVVASAEAQGQRDRAHFGRDRTRKLQARRLTAGDYASVFLDRAFDLPEPAPGYEFAVVVMRQWLWLFVEVPRGLTDRLSEMSDRQIISSQSGEVKELLRLFVEESFEDAAYFLSLLQPGVEARL